MLPIGSSGIGIEEIHPVGTWNVIGIALHLLPHIRTIVNLRPHTEHQTNIHRMKAIGQGFGIRIVSLVELHGVPAVFTPILPVLHDET